MGDRATFKGYGSEQGYPWLREKIAAHDFQARGCDIDASEIFISDGSKCDTGNILDIFGDGNRIAVTDPVYPVYVDTNVMAGHTGEANDAASTLDWSICRLPLKITSPPRCPVNPWI